MSKRVNKVKQGKYYKVEKVICSRKTASGRFEYLLRWEGYPEYNDNFIILSFFLKNESNNILKGMRVVGNQRKI